jgi:hypothetical protein
MWQIIAAAVDYVGGVDSRQYREQVLGLIAFDHCSVVDLLLQLGVVFAQSSHLTFEIGHLKFYHIYISTTIAIYIDNSM